MLHSFQMRLLLPLFMNSLLKSLLYKSSFYMNPFYMSSIDIRHWDPGGGG